MASPTDINLGSPAMSDAERAALENLTAGTTTLASVLDSTAGDGRKAVTTSEKTAVAALTVQVAAGSTNLITPAESAVVSLATAGAKATVSVTLVAWGDWADGLTASVPGVAAHTIRKTSTGDIDVSGASTIAEAAAIVGPFLAAHAGSLVDYVGTVGQVMTFRAKTVGSAINGQLVAGTLFTADVPALNGVAIYDGLSKGEVLIDSWAPLVGATAHDFPVAPANWRALRMVVCSTPSPLCYVRADGTTNIPGSCLRIVAGESPPSLVEWSLAEWWGGGGGDVGGPCEVVLVFPTATGAYASLGVTADRWFRGFCVPPTVSIGVQAAPSYPFTGGATRVELWGTPR